MFYNALVRLAAVAGLSMLFVSVAAAADAPQRPEPIELWPAGAPGEKGDLPPEADQGGKPGDNTIRLGNVSVPTISIYKPKADVDTGAAVVICPGGGYNILAMNKEGTEVAEWLNTLGVTGIVLKYRVPAKRDGPRGAAPQQDVQRAISLVRHRASEWSIDPNRIGVLGFSAGGHLAALASNDYTLKKYPAADRSDSVSCRPDFALLIYPAYLVDKENKISPELKITEETPPTFIAMTEDDGVRVEGALFYYLALKNAKVPAEMHLYPKGGHGYGLRPSDNLVSTWPARAADWLKSSGLLERK